MFEKEPYYNEKIEAYLRNQLSAEEKADFEQMIQKDPLLLNEYALQRDIISSIQAHRKAELKQRLERIDVSSLGTSGSNTILVAGFWLTGLAILSLAGWFSIEYFRSNSIESNPASTKPEKQVAVQKAPLPATSTQKELISKLPSTPDSQTANQLKGKLPGSTTQQRVAPNSSTTPIIRPKVSSEEQTLDSPKEEEIVVGDAGLPVERPATHTTGSVYNRLNITDNSNSKLRLHYTYQDGQIRLIGFDEPYTLVEIQPENITYLYYGEKFYRLNPGQDKPAAIAEVEVKDDELIQSLKARLLSRK